MLTGLEWRHKHTIVNTSFSELHWISYQHLAVCAHRSVKVYEVTPESSRLAHQLPSKEWDGLVSSVAVSDSIPDSILVVCGGIPYVYHVSFPCYSTTHKVKKYRINCDYRWTVPRIVANANTAVVISHGYPQLTVCSLPDFKKQSQVHLKFTPQDLSISSDNLLVMGYHKMVVKPLGDLSQDLCWIKLPDEATTFDCVSFANNAREIHVVCGQSLRRVSVYHQYTRCSGSNPSYINDGIVIPPVPFTSGPKNVFLAVNSNGSLLAMTNSTGWGTTHIYSRDYRLASVWFG